MHVSGLVSRRRVRLGQVRSAQIMSVILILLSTLFFGAPAFAATPAVGAKVPDFTLSTPSRLRKKSDGKTNSARDGLAGASQAAEKPSFARWFRLL